MEQLPWYIPATFILTTLLTVFLFSKAARYSTPFLFLLIMLIIIQSVLGISGFYNDEATATTRFPLLVAPMLLVGLWLFFTSKGKSFLDSMDMKTLTILHVIRIPVEIVLFWLFVYNTIPQAMTFEGRNFDILSGLTAPIIYYFGFVKQKLSRPVLIVWNAACILLLLNVVASAVLSLPARFQNFGFEKPNVAVGYFPYLLLPSILVPLVLLANAVAIRQLIRNKTINAG